MKPSGSLGRMLQASSGEDESFVVSVLLLLQAWTMDFNHYISVDKNVFRDFGISGSRRLRRLSCFNVFGAGASDKTIVNNTTSVVIY